MRGRKTVLTERELLLFQKMCKAVPRVWNNYYTESPHRPYEVVKTFRNLRSRNSYKGVRELLNKGFTYAHVAEFLRYAGLFGYMLAYPRQQRAWIDETIAFIAFEDEISKMSDADVRRTLMLDMI